MLLVAGVALVPAIGCGGGGGGGGLSAGLRMQWLKPTQSTRMPPRRALRLQS